MTPAPPKCARFVDATGFPVEPSVSPAGVEYWYRDDISERRRWARKHRRSQEDFYSSERWAAVERLFDGLFGDSLYRTIRKTRCEIAFEVPSSTEEGT